METRPPHTLDAGLASPEVLGRRDFLTRTALLSLGAAAGWNADAGPVLATVAPIQRAGGPYLKVSLNAYSFAKLLNNYALGRGGAKMSLFDLAEFCAKHNFDGFDPTGYYFPGYRERKLPDDKLVFDLKRRAFDLGLGISGTGVGNNFTTADAAARAKDVEWIKQWAEVAAKLGAPVLRVFADTQMRAQTWETVSNGAKREEVEAWIADDIRTCAEHVGKLGVIIGVQNHGDFIKTADHRSSQTASDCGYGVSTAVLAENSSAGRPVNSSKSTDYINCQHTSSKDDA